MALKHIQFLILFQYIWLNFKGSICVSHSRPDFFNDRVGNGSWPLLLSENNANNFDSMKVHGGEKNNIRTNTFENNANLNDNHYDPKNPFKRLRKSQHRLKKGSKKRLPFKKRKNATSNKSLDSVNHRPRKTKTPIKGGTILNTGGTYNPKQAWRVIDSSRQFIPTEMDLEDYYYDNKNTNDHHNEIKKRYRSKVSMPKLSRPIKGKKKANNSYRLRRYGSYTKSYPGKKPFRLVPQSRSSINGHRFKSPPITYEGVHEPYIGIKHNHDDAVNNQEIVDVPPESRPSSPFPQNVNPMVTNDIEDLDYLNSPPGYTNPVATSVDDLDYLNPPTVNLNPMATPDEILDDFDYINSPIGVILSTTTTPVPTTTRSTTRITSTSPSTYFHQNDVTENDVVIYDDIYYDDMIDKIPPINNIKLKTTSYTKNTWPAHHYQPKYIPTYKKGHEEHGVPNYKYPLLKSRRNVLRQFLRRMANHKAHHGPEYQLHAEPAPPPSYSAPSYHSPSLQSGYNFHGAVNGSAVALKRSLGWTVYEDDEDPSSERQLSHEPDGQYGEQPHMEHRTDLFPFSGSHFVMGIESSAAIGLLGLLLFINVLRDVIRTISGRRKRRKRDIIITRSPEDEKFLKILSQIHSRDIIRHRKTHKSKH